jgi:hypothetical protein
MRIGAVIAAVWLVIGIIAAAQRGYFSNTNKDCGNIGDTVITIVAGPFNYIGVNPKVECPQPSK